ncbi:hypothetical protein [Pseudonocardia spinosispora]|uniref:hypothetical protein n=1 Tax=Pseudonocardia spinosispora TaxID=103441 RepID=UPI00146FA6C9|nr:hypothetical protein [Pseudonocardia spinosispora]
MTAALLVTPIAATAPVTAHTVPAALTVQTATPLGLTNDRLLPGQRLASGESLTVPDTRSPEDKGGFVSLEMLPKGNLLIEAWIPPGHGSSQRWNSGTDGNPGARVEMQLDGNLVIYSVTDKPLWDSKTSGHPGAYVVLQGDRNLVMHDVTGNVIWATNSND